MAEDFKDPREVPFHPRLRTTLHGHEAAEQRLRLAAQSGKLHHAWLISGAEGIGKATLAYRFARFLLQHGWREAESLAVPETAMAARLVASSAHPDLLVVQRGIDTRNKKLKTEIAVEDARIAAQFFAHTAAMGGYRICIVDSADELNAESANALLKIIEEPPEQAVFLIVAHRPGALLPTIRSRTTHLALKPLSPDLVTKVLAEVSSAPEPELAEAAALSEGSPGRALRLIESKGAKAFAQFLGKPKLTLTACVDIGGHFAHRDNALDFDVFAELLDRWITARARERALAGGGRALALAHAEITHSIRQTDALNLDRRQTVVDALVRLAEALKSA